MNIRLNGWMKWAGYILFAIFVFFIMFYLTLPYERIRTAIESQLSSPDREVKVASISARPLLGVTLNDVLITLIKKAASGEDKDKKHRMRIEKLSASFGLFALLSKRLDVDFDIEGMGGTVEGSLAFHARKNKIQAFSFEAEIENLSANEIAYLQMMGPPLGGKLSGKINFAFDKGKINLAEGDVDLDLVGATIGDDKAKIKVKGNPMLAAGVTLPKIRLGKVSLKMPIKKGKVELERVSARSSDIEIKAEGDIYLRQPFNYSRVKNYIMLKLSPQIVKEKPTLAILEPALMKGKRADGFFGILISGIFRSPQVRPSKLGIGQGRNARPGSVRSSVPRTSRNLRRR